MKKILKLLKGMPLWRLFLTELLLVAAIGYVDYLTGDYSILIFYAVPVALAAWFHREWGAIIISLAAGSARYISDYYSYSDSNVRYLNSISDMLFLLIIGLILSATLRLINDDRGGKRGTTATHNDDQSVLYFKKVRGLK
jgi:inner membrane protein involved in colicin E2 resistance